MHKLGFTFLFFSRCSFLRLIQRVDRLKHRKREIRTTLAYSPVTYLKKAQKLRTTNTWPVARTSTSARTDGPQLIKSPKVADSLILTWFCANIYSWVTVDDTNDETTLSRDKGPMSCGGRLSQSGLPLKPQRPCSLGWHLLDLHFLIFASTRKSGATWCKNAEARMFLKKNLTCAQES